MTPLILTAAEAALAAADKLTEIRRPCDEANGILPGLPAGVMDPAAAVFPDGAGTGWVAWWGRGPFSAEETVRVYPGAAGFQCPFGVAERVELVDGVWQWVLAVERVNLNGAPVPPVECQ